MHTFIVHHLVVDGFSDVLAPGSIWVPSSSKSGHLLEELDVRAVRKHVDGVGVEGFVPLNGLGLEIQELTTGLPSDFKNFDCGRFRHFYLDFCGGFCGNSRKVCDAHRKLCDKILAHLTQPVSMLH